MYITRLILASYQAAAAAASLLPQPPSLLVKILGILCLPHPLLLPSCHACLYLAATAHLPSPTYHAFPLPLCLPTLLGTGLPATACTLHSCMHALPAACCTYGQGAGRVGGRRRGGRLLLSPLFPTAHCVVCGVRGVAWWAVKTDGELGVVLGMGMVNVNDMWAGVSCTCLFLSHSCFTPPPSHTHTHTFYLFLSHALFMSGFLLPVFFPLHPSLSEWHLSGPSALFSSPLLPLLLSPASSPLSLLFCLSLHSSCLSRKDIVFCNLL